MGQESRSRVYEQIASTDLAGYGIRPGGLELTERALSCCDFPSNARIIDVGCGTGVTLAQLTRVHYFCGIGIDPSPVLLDQGRRKGSDLMLVRGTGEDLPFPDECADAVFAECSLSVMAYRNRVLDEFGRVLKVGGRLVLTDVYARNGDAVNQLMTIPLHCCVRGAVSEAEVVKEVTDRNFIIELWEDHSERLKNFAVQLIFSYGSMNQFWVRAGAEPVDTGNIQRAISSAKPGYFLLIAKKKPR
jgi:ubiquinone/menaquinone biosynthesis C-methylase UbiE